jgi:hypothetical protein
MEAALDGCPKFKILKRSGVFSIDRGYLHWNSGACAGKGVLSIMLG